MLIWFCSLLCLGLAVRTVSLDTSWTEVFQGARRSRELKRVEALLFELQECLEAGLVPEPARWDELRALPAPWGRLTSGSVRELRRQGAALLPTLRRLRELAREQAETQRESQSRSAQALAQAAICGLLVPVFGATLQLLLPGVDENGTVWWIACLAAWLFALSGACWTLAIADQARWGRLSPERRPWILGALCAGERFLALVRSGSPADLAWVSTGEFLNAEVPGLATQWGHSVWMDPAERSSLQRGGPVLKIIADAGAAIRRAVQVSLMEGKPCSERVEVTLAGLRADLRSAIGQELELIATRALKPLFFCAAPSVMALLGFGLYLSFKESL